MSLSDYAWQLLQPVLNLGLKESDFWDMTLAEVERYSEGAKWRLKNKAEFDYIHANLIGISVSRMFDNNVKYPSIEEIYPNLFEEEKVEAEKQKKEVEEKTTSSVNNFLNFARQLNAKFGKQSGETDGN